MTKMVFMGLREDQDVIKVDNNEVIKKVEKDGIHHSLEGAGGVGESEGHYVKLVRTVTTGEGGLVAVFGGDWKLVVPVA